MQLMGIPNGVQGVKQTLKIMRQLVRDGKKSLIIRRKAQELTAGLNQKDFLGEIRAIHRFVRDHIRYVKDVNGVETLHTPEKVLEFGQGDCDDKSVLVAALLESIGHPSRFVAISQSKGNFCHVYVETRIGRSNKWITVETTEPVELNWQPKKVSEKLIAHI